MTWLDLENFSFHLYGAEPLTYLVSRISISGEKHRAQHISYGIPTRSPTNMINVGMLLPLMNLKAKVRTKRLNRIYLEIVRNRGKHSF